MTAFLRKLHFWLGVVLGLQLVVWTVSGVVMSLLDHHEVMRSPRQPSEPVALPSGLIEPSLFSAGARTVELSTIAGKLVYRVERPDGIELRDASSGDVIRLTPGMASAIATSSIESRSVPVSIDALDAPIDELRGFEGPVYRARFADDVTVVVDARDGRVRAVRTQAWRIFDLAFMLHTMDYTRRGNFNSAWVIAAAVIALWLALSGALLVVRDLRRGGYSLRRSR